MNRCSSYSGGADAGAHCNNMVGPCSCGLFHTHQTPNSNSANSFSMLFSSFDPHGYNQGSDFCPFPSPSSSTAVVDCTLSLGTPSTRMSSSSLASHHDQRKPSSYMSNFCWDILQSKPSSTHHKNGRGNNITSTTNSGSGGGDTLLARRCANCDTTSTPLWRNGPRGPKSLCNACGIRFKKEERRANAAASTNGGGGGAQAMVVESQHVINGTTSWVHHSQTTHKLPSCYSPAAAIGNEFRFIDDVDDRDSPFLSWRLNVTDRPGLVHDFTR